MSSLGLLNAPLRFVLTHVMTPGRLFPVPIGTSITAIREIRELQALSQEAFARLLGVSVRTVARWESGVSQPSPLALEKLRQAVPQGEIR